MVVLLCTISFAFLYIFKCVNCSNVTNESHLKYICSTRHIICNYNTNICAVNKINESLVYKDFTNVCYLFLNNACDHTGREFSIAWSGTCNDYFNSRRNNDVGRNETSVKNTNSTQAQLNIQRINTTYNIGRENKNGSKELKHTVKMKTTTPFNILYEVAVSFDDHTCPLICPSIYSPVCVTANRGYGKYFKYFSFINHCAGDLYYCKHWREFASPPDEYEIVNVSPLGWSFCGSARYLQFARFSEAISSLGHYGWLGGNYKYSHIMEPHERIPGLG